MRVLNVINSLGTGGAEKLLIESIPLYNSKGIETDLLLLNGFEYPFYNEFIKKKSGKLVSLGKGSVYNLFLIFKLIPFLKKYDVIHVHLFPSLYWVALAKMISFSQTKLIYTEHSTSNRRRNVFFAIIDKLLYAQYSKIVCITDEVAKNLQLHLNLKDNSKFSIIQNGLNLEEIHNAKGYDKKRFFEDSDAKIVITVARFYEPKDHKTVIKAMQLLPKNYKLLLVGDGVLKKECEELVSTLDLNNRILFLGVRTDVLSLLKTADCIVLSSKHEGLSLSCIEGMASGKPFIASNVPGLKEIVSDAGILFPLGDEKTLANAILKLNTDNQLFDEIVTNCIKKSKGYDVYNMIESYSTIYKELNER